VAVVVDDRLLLDCLAGRAPEPVGSELEMGGVFTTSAWYFRLGRAAFGSSGAGALSNRLQELEQVIQDRIRSGLQDLPLSIGLLHPRVVVPVMFALRVRRQLNVLTAEALAVALVVQARVVVTTDAPLLRAGSGELGLDYELIR
jgi:hypothetical protein